MRLIIFIFVIFFTGEAHADDIWCAQTYRDQSAISNVREEFRIEPDECSIAKFEGRISTGDAEVISNFLSENPSVLYLRLNLVGGEVYEAMRIGYLVRQWNLVTISDGADTCSSSCILVWLSGIYRIADPASLRVHRFYLFDDDFAQMSGAEIDRFYQDITSDLRSYLSDMGVDADQDELIRSIMTVPPDELRPITSLSHPRLFKAPDARDQWMRANGCINDGETDTDCFFRLIINDRAAAGLLSLSSE